MAQYKGRGNPGKSRTRWSPEEWCTMMPVIQEYQRQGLANAAAVIKAQTLLPKDRQREPGAIHGSSRMDAILAKYSKVLASGIIPKKEHRSRDKLGRPLPPAPWDVDTPPAPPQAAPQTPVAQPAPTPAPLELSREIQEALAFKREHQCPPTTTPEQALGFFLVDTLVTVAKRLLLDPEIRALATDFTRGLVEHELRQRREQFIPGDQRTLHVPVQPIGPAAPTPRPGAQPMPPEPERVRPPVILLCGFKPHQRAVFEKELGAKLRVKFWYDEGIPALKAKAIGADHVFLTVEATPHAARHAVEQTVGGAWNLIPGGQSGMLIAIKEWAKTRKGVMIE